MGNQDREVWILGSKSPYADKCIQWNDLSYPNFHEPDVLVIDLTSLDEGILQRIDKTKFELARKQVFAKFINGGTVIYIITQRRKPSGEHMTGANQTAAGREGTGKAYSYSNYDISPIEFQIQTTEGTRINLYNDEFSPYFKFVKKFSYYLNNFEMSSSLKDLEQDNDIVSKIAKFLRCVGKDKSRDSLELVANDIALDNSNHTLSAICWLKIDGYWNSGKAIYLPPSTQIPVEESLDVLLRIYGKTTTNETFPDWTYKIQLPQMKAIELKLENLRSENLNLEKRINAAKREKLELENHYRLLVSKGQVLEDAVYEAFKLLGFGEIAKRSVDKEDLVFEFSTLSNYRYGVIEVKGSDTKTGLDDLRRCENWASDYLQEYNADAKGIFIANQYRREEYPVSRSNRLHFEPNQKGYAEKHDICIIPSCVVFEAIENILSTGNTDRKQVENRIACHKGVLNNLI